MSIGRVPIRRLASVFLGKMIQPEPKSGADVSTPYLRAAHIQPGGRLVDVEAKEMWFDPLELRRHDLRAGDVVVVEGGAGYGRSAFLSADRPGWGFQNSILRLRPFDGEATGRLINYALLVALEAGEIAAEVSTATIPHFTAEKVGSFEVPMAPRGDRLRIANYLDDQVVRMDKVISLRQQQVAALDEWLVAMRGAAFDREARMVPFKAAVWFREGPGIMADDFRDEGVPLLRIANLRSGTFTLDGANFLDPKLVASKLAHFRVRPGEILTSGSASGGLAVQAPEAARGTIPYTGIIRMRPRAEDLTAPYLRHFLLSPQFLSQMDMLKTGVAIQHWGPYHLGLARMPLLASKEQEIVSRQLDKGEVTVRRASSEMQAQVKVLLERKRSLITAAVTGEFDVSTASGRGVA